MSTIDKETGRLTLAKWVFSPLAGVTLGPWLKILRHYCISIPPRYWARTLFTTGMAMLNSVIQMRETDAFYSDKYSIKQPLFIIGHHRSGTTHLWKLLSVDDKRFIYPTVTETIFPNTLLTFDNIATAWARRLSPRKRPQDNVKSSSDSPMGEEWALCASTFISTHMARHFPYHRERFKPYLTLKELDIDQKIKWQQALDKFARKLLYKHQGKGTLLFKAPTHTAKIHALLELYPDARFIHIHRNPYEVFKSTVRMELKSLPMCAYQKFNLDELEDYIIWRYKTMYNSFFEDVNQIPAGQFTQLAYEDLIQDRLKSIKKIYDDLNIDRFDNVKPELESYIQSISDYQKNIHPPLQSSQLEKLNDQWYPIIKKLGYKPILLQ